MQIRKYRNFDCLSGCLKDYIWVIFSPDHFLDLISRPCPRRATGRCVAGAAAGWARAQQSQLTQGEELHHRGVAGPAEVDLVLQSDLSTRGGVGKKLRFSTIFFVSFLEQV